MARATKRLSLWPETGLLRRQLAPRNDDERRLYGRALGLGAAQMLVEARHDLDEIAGARAVVQLGFQDAVPAVAAGARRARQAEDEGRAGGACGGAALDGGRADLGMAE